MIGSGQCFPYAAQLILSMVGVKNTVVLVHGYVKLSSSPLFKNIIMSGAEIGFLHAWVEIDNKIVKDCVGTSPRETELSQYTAFICSGTPIKKYTSEEAQQNMIITGKYGPWDNKSFLHDMMPCSNEFLSTNINNNPHNICDICGIITTSFCGVCGSVFYCSKECQKKGWKDRYHWLECTTMNFNLFWDDDPRTLMNIGELLGQYARSGGSDIDLDREHGLVGSGGSRKRGLGKRELLTTSKAKKILRDGVILGNPLRRNDIFFFKWVVDGREGGLEYT